MGKSGEKLELTVEDDEWPKSTLQDIDNSAMSMVLVRGQALADDRAKVAELIQKYHGKVVQYSFEDSQWQKRNGVGRFEGSQREREVDGHFIMDFTLGLNRVLGLTVSLEDTNNTKEYQQSFTAP